MNKMEIKSNPNLSLYNMQLRDTAKQTQSNSVSIENKGRNALVETLKSNPAAIYHKTGEQIPETYDPTLELRMWSYPETDEEHHNREVETYRAYSQMAKSYGEIEPIFSDFMKQLSKMSPGLAEKDWGFTVDKEGALAVFDPDQVLTKDETERLTSLLNADESLVKATGKMPEFLTKAFELEKGPGTHSFGWARYYVTEENFKDIIDIRKFVEIAQDKAEYLDNGGDPAYIWKYISTHAFEEEMASQLSGRAENRYQAIRYSQGMSDEKYEEMKRGSGWILLNETKPSLQDQK